MSTHTTDVAIIGTGFAGSILGAILARHGVDVLLLDRVAHPRFAIGESTVPETTALLKAVAARYDVPPIADIADFHRARDRVGPSSGVKRSFSFAWHRAGERHRGADSHMFPTWAPPFGPDLHYFRQDIDAWLFHVALRYGADMRVPADVKGVAIDADGVTLDLGADTVRARYVVDAAGFGSPLVRHLGWRASTDGMHTDSGGVFTHMIGVRPYDEVGPPAEEHGLPYAFHEGTLHHVFDGGWMWVIPFGNHPGGRNPITSVGVCLDNRRAGVGQRSAPDVFRDVLARFPSIAPQFTEARAVRPWVSARRMQSRSRQMFGDRCCLMPHAAGFIDPLTSSGLTMTALMLNRLPRHLLGALGDGRFERERFAGIERDQWRAFDHYDTAIARFYDAFADYDTWDACFRAWVLTSNYGLSGVQRVMAGFRRVGAEALELFEDDPFSTPQGIGFEPAARTYGAVGEALDAAAAGRISPREARDRAFAILDESGLCPTPWRLTDPERRFPTTFTVPGIVEYMKWARGAAPDSVRDTYFGGSSGGGGGGAFMKLIARELLGEAWSEGRDAGARVLGRLMDSVRATPWVGTPDA